MTYRQDKTQRHCSICKNPIQMEQWMLDLFRGSESRPVEWAHEVCARTAIETWIKKKEEKTK